MVIPGPCSDSVGERWATGIFSSFPSKPDNPDAGANPRLAGLSKRCSSVMKLFITQQQDGTQGPSTAERAMTILKF